MTGTPAVLSWLGVAARATAGAWLRVVSLFRKSLQLRVVAATVFLTSVAIYGVGAYMSQNIAQKLFDSRVEQATRQAASYGEDLQTTGAASNQNGTGEAGSLSATLLTQLQGLFSRSSVPLRSIYLQPMPGNNTGPAISQPAPNKPPFTIGQLSDDLVSMVKSSRGTQHYQALELPAYPPDSPTPGLAVGTLVTIPGAGQFQLYVISDLSAEEMTLQLVQRTMWIAGLVLLVLVGAIGWTVANIVVKPVRIAASVSEKLAEGDLDQRMPVRGNDEIATLAVSFNDMAAALQDQITRMETLSVVQRRFVSDVSHELRTPLTTIRIAGELMYESREDFDPITARSAELLHSQIQRFESLLSDLLEISRFDAGAAALDAEAHDVLAVVRKVIESVQMVVDRSNTVLTLHAPSAPVMADVDARRIERIVRNLVVNAVEHGEGRPIEIYLATDADAVAVSVRDHGIGMDHSQVERVFDRFWRADPARQRTLGGTGLGLAISLEDAHLHAGWLQAWGRPGEGACFRLTIPRRAGHELVSSPLPLPPADASKAAREDDEVPEPLSSDSSVRVSTGSLQIISPKTPEGLPPGAATEGGHARG